MSNNLFRGMDVSASGLHAEWARMQVIANNLANAETTHTAEGGPYRKRFTVFTTMLNSLQGVRVKGVVPSSAEPRRVYKPGHPDADDEGYVAMPDIKLPLEMIDMVTASRAYEANLKAMRTYRQLCQETIKLLR